MNPRDQLRALELSAIIEEATSALRHDVRNRLGSIRNMVYYVRKRVAGMEAAQREPRVLEFLADIETEVQRADEIMEQWRSDLGRVYSAAAQKINAPDSIRFAVNSARINSSVSVSISAEDAALELDPLEFALALRCLIENAAEAGGPEPVSVEGKRDSEMYRIVVRNAGTKNAQQPMLGRPFRSTKAGHFGVGLGIAQRIALRNGGALMFATEEQRIEVALALPLADVAPRRISVSPARESSHAEEQSHG